MRVLLKVDEIFNKISKKFDLVGDARGKVRGSPKILGFFLSTYI